MYTYTMYIFVNRNNMMMSHLHLLKFLFLGTSWLFHHKMDWACPMVSLKFHGCKLSNYCGFKSPIALFSTLDRICTESTVIFSVHLKQCTQSENSISVVCLQLLISSSVSLQNRGYNNGYYQIFFKKQWIYQRENRVTRCMSKLSVIISIKKLTTTKT